jgi:hypothetical protein
MDVCFCMLMSFRYRSELVNKFSLSANIQTTSDAVPKGIEHAQDSLANLLMAVTCIDLAYNHCEIINPLKRLATPYTPHVARE